MEGHGAAGDVRLVLTDVDGTILPYDREVVSDACLAAFHEALDAGIRVGPASGRGAARVPEVFGGDGRCCATMLASNGMQVCLDGELVHEEHIGRDALVHLAGVVAELEVPGCGMVCFDGPRALVVAGEVADLTRSFRSYASTARPVDEVPRFPVVKANVFTPPDRAVTARVVELLRRRVPEIDYSLPMPGFVNTTPTGWSKASAVDVLARELGIGLDQVVVFGDSGNDLEMLAHVPNSAAVAGATPEAAAAARWHVGRCEDDAVPRAISELARGRWPFSA